jgi:hypothetical protein
MKHIMKKSSMQIAALMSALAVTTTAHAQTPPTMKMTTDIPEEITTPDKVETRVGTLNFKNWTIQSTVNSSIHR